MKEFQFTPSSKMLTISEGEEMNVDMVAVRVAFSCYGKLPDSYRGTILA